MDKENDQFAIIIHGGASVNLCKSEAETLKYYTSILNCIQPGIDILKKNGKAVDAVEATIRALEDDPLFNAGTGSCLTSAGTVEMDAMIMDGSNLMLGSVGCVDCTSHPISLARLVMEQSSHCMIVGDGAKRFAQLRGFQLLSSPQCLITPVEKQNLIKYKHFDSACKSQMNVSRSDSCDTVGAVALDIFGNLACGASTGGICGKLPGRIGDAALVGCGGFANEFGAATCTGHGESMMRLMCCKSVIEQIEHGETPYDAAKIILKNMFNKMKSCGGVIVLDKSGSIGVYHSAEFMPWASYSSNCGLQTFNTKS